MDMIEVPKSLLEHYVMLEMKLFTLVCDEVLNKSSTLFEMRMRVFLDFHLFLEPMNTSSLGFVNFSNNRV
jgi:hypothetical protein